MKILLVSSYLPYPLLDGGRIRLYNLLKFLKDKHEIILICEKRDNQTEEDVREVEKICSKVIWVKRKKQWSPQNILKAYLTTNSFLMVGHNNSEMKKAIEEEMIREKFDLIHVETSYVYQNLPKVSIPTVLVEHNIEYMVYKRYTKNAPVFLQPLLMIDVLKLKRTEQNLWNEATFLVAVSQKEKELMGRKDAFVVPNGVDLNRFTMKKLAQDKKEKKLLFIGDFKWIQNRDSANFIIKSIWPKLQSHKEDMSLKLWIVGKNIPDSIKKYNGPDIIIDENAPRETQTIFQNSDLLISPVRVGGGTNFKILESMACGTPVLTNSLGNEGLNAKNGEEILIRENPEEFASAAIGILKDPYLYEKISHAGRAYVEQNFEWGNIANTLDSIYRKAQ